MASCQESEVKGFHWKLRRMVDNLTGFFEGGTKKSHPETADVLRCLKQAVEKEMATKRNRLAPTCTRQRRTSPVPAGVTRKH